MSSSAARQRWREKRTKYIIDFCAQNNFKLDMLNQGYQLRIEDTFDFYPTNGRWHFLPTGERGDWHTDNDLKLVILEMLDKNKPKQFEPRPYQKALLDNYKHDEPVMIMRSNGRTRFVGVDMGTKDGDKTVIAHGIKGRDGITKIWFDEYAEWPDYKWYRNPIKWWKMRSLMKLLERNRKQYERTRDNR